MASQDPGIVGDSFQVGYRFQHYWDASMARAFFSCEVGAGLFLVSMLYDFALGMLLGILITGILKTYFHLAHMGVPLKAWRAILRPDRSWTSRGLIGIAFFTSFGLAQALNVWLDLETMMGFGPAITNLMQLVAGVAALVVITYQGFAMSASSAIALWHTIFMPISSLVYGLTSGVLLALVLGWSRWLSAGSAEQLVNAGLALLLLDFAVLASLMISVDRGSSGGKLSVELLLKTLYRKRFLSLVVGVGLFLPILLLSLAPGLYLFVLVACAAALTGFYAYRALVFKAGVYDPMPSFRPSASQQQ